MDEKSCLLHKIHGYRICDNSKLLIFRIGTEEKTTWNRARVVQEINSLIQGKQTNVVKYNLAVLYEAVKLLRPE